MTMQIDSNRVIVKMTGTIGENSQLIAVLKVQIDMLTEENEKLKQENEILSNKE